MWVRVTEKEREVGEFIDYIKDLVYEILEMGKSIIFNLG